jgi:predicted  nucleic acid-binding Zn-ribbon protein
MLKYSSDQNGKLNTLFFAIIVLIILSLTNNLFSSFNNDNTKYLKEEMEQIKKGIKNYENENKKLQKKVVEYEKLLIKIDSNISTNNKKIDKLKLDTNEKINSFKSYDARMWEKFFADRYKK